jgi:hypothetical protein
LTNSNMGHALKAAILAGAFSGIPSTAWCLVRRRDPLEATMAAGAILLPNEARRGRLLLAAVPVHGSLSLAWTLALSAILPTKGTVISGAFAGLGIAAVDLGVLSRFFPSVQALPLGPQVADHLAFGALAGAVIRHSRLLAGDC